ncbi:hypothetical protein [Ancylomarina longa]|uniref:Uncharacterized protein n=1 Tax=Ancylomarina longa TaxID=2487017 RepID=A0A434AG04_9BACT|nr:hypothetical protein [Ancylomarina longa]RUT73308.1 hypothetical protein DLK05_14140 [Ancylomarina longa]
MRNTIQIIIQSKIPKEFVFDTHSIIDYLIQYHSDIYLSSHQNGWTTEFYHSEISKLIASFEGSIIKRQGECWSRNIHFKFSQNACWLKL